MSTDIDVPRNMEAEKATIGSVLQDPKGVIWADARRYLHGEDFWHPAHATIWSIVEALHAAEQPVDAITVMNRLQAAGELARIGGGAYLHTCIESVPTAANVAHYAEAVKGASRARRALQIQMRMGQVISEHAGDMDALLAGLARENLAMELLVDERAAEMPLDGFMRWSELWNLYRADAGIQWLVPDLLVAEDVFMLLAGEGGGKSWFTRQFCLCLAAGVHPLYPGRRIEPVRSLLVDLENAPAMVAYESRQIGSQIVRLGEFDDDLARVWLKEDGLNLRDPAHALLLERAIDEAQPKLLAIGSLYKAFKRGRDDWETAAEETRDVLDKLRRRYGFALLIEHHMPKATGNNQDRPTSPYGSSTWMKWPSIGQIINRVGDNMYELVDFRGTRLERDLPKALKRGGLLPWTSVWDQAEVDWAKWPELASKNPRRPAQ